MTNQLLSVTEAAREAGVNRSTIQRWIAKGLKKREAGKLQWKDVIRWRDRHRTGRPHGLPASYALPFLSDAQKGHALTFLDGRRGLLRFKAMLPGLVAYHVKAGRESLLQNVLSGAYAAIAPELLRRAEAGGRRAKARERSQRAKLQWAKDLAFIKSQNRSKPHTVILS